MKKILSVLAAVSMIAIMASCATSNEVEKTAKPVEEWTAVATENGIELTGIVPMKANQVRFYRNDSTSDTMFECGALAYWPGTGDGTEKTFVDYFVNPGQDYEYEIQIIINYNWNKPKKYYVHVTNGEGGKGEMVATDISSIKFNENDKTVSGITPVEGQLIEGARDLTGINAWTLKDNLCYYDEVPYWKNIVQNGVLDLNTFTNRSDFNDISKFKVTLSSAQYIRDEENGININYLGRQLVIFDGSNLK